MDLKLEFEISMVESMPESMDLRGVLPENVACKATIEEYLALNEICEYRIEYHQGFIISLAQNIYESMNNHERIVFNLLSWLSEYILKNNLAWDVFTSNALIYIHDLVKPHCYKPDASVFEKEPTEIEFINSKDSKKYKANLDPKVVMEVLSKGTQTYDLTTKLANYKKIESLQQIVFVEQNKIGVYIHERMGENWSESKYFEENDTIFISECPILIKKLYRNVKF